MKTPARFPFIQVILMSLIVSGCSKIPELIGLSGKGKGAAAKPTDTGLTGAVVLHDAVTNSELLTNNRVVFADISVGNAVKRWCVSETQIGSPGKGSDPCDGGVGSLNGWSETLPPSFQLSNGDGLKTVYLWVAASANGAAKSAGSGSITLDTTAPNAPSGLALSNPASSPGIEPSPSILVSGVVSGDTVKLFSDSSCTTLKGSTLATGTTAVVSVAVALADNVYTFYANSTDGVGNISTCSTANVVYDLDRTPNTAPIAVADAAAVYNTSGVVVSPLGNDTDVDGHTITMTGVGTPSSGTVTSTATTITYTPAAGYVGSATVTYTISDGNGGAATGTITYTVTTPPTFSWTGATGNNVWSTAGNWQGGAVPGAGDLALFNTACFGVKCNASITANPNVGGISMQAGYTGTITQGVGVAISLGDKHFTQAAGTFTGSNAAIGTAWGSFILSGGIFNSTSGAVTVYGGATSFVGSGVFNHNNGKFIIRAGGNFNAGTAAFYDVDFILWSAWNVDLQSSTVRVARHFQIIGNNDVAGVGGGGVVAGTVEVGGNLTAMYGGALGSAIIKLVGNAAGQTITSDGSSNIPNITIAAGTNPVTLSGTILVGNDFIATSASSLTTTGSTLKFTHWSGGGVSDFQSNSSFTYNNVSLLGGCWAQQWYDLGATTINVAGLLYFAGNCDNVGVSVFAVSNGTFNVTGNVLSRYGGANGSALVLMAGNAAGQTLTGDRDSRVPNLEIAAGLNNVAFSGSVYVASNYRMTSVGTLDTTGELVIGGDSSSVFPGSVTYGQVSFLNGCWARTPTTLNGGTMKVGGTLNIYGTCSFAGSSQGSMHTGNIDAYGDVNILNGGIDGTILIRMVGAANRNFAINVAGFTPTEMQINTTGTVFLTTNVLMQNWGSSKFTVTNGTLDMAGFNLTMSGTLALGGTTMVKNGGTLTVAGTPVVCGSCYGGTIDP